MKMKMLTVAAIAAATIFGTMATACEDDNYKMKYPPKFELPELPDVGDIHTFKAPLYWSIYEYCYDLECAGVANESMDYTLTQWTQTMDWIAENLKPHGYDMVCTDGFIPMTARNGSLYMTHYGSVALKDLVAEAKKRGLKVGVYDNPMWIHCSLDKTIPGTDIKVGALRYNGTEPVNNPKVDDMWFTWGIATHAGAQEWIDGFFKHYKELGIEYIRMDFLCWYEDGFDRGMGKVGHGYGRENYARYLNYIAQAAKKYGIFTSLVMPHLYNDAEVEKMYGNMVRIVRDTREGGWWFTSQDERGNTFQSWPNCNNQFDGFAYWNHVSGRDKLILDGDFLRLHNYANEAEKQSVIALQLMAGGPVTIADQPGTVGDNLKYYQNDELLALNADRFVGQPLADKSNGTVWYGSMTNGDVVVGIFNRDDNAKTVNLPLSAVGVNTEMSARDLWLHSDMDNITSIKASIPAHGCKIVRLSKPLL